MLVKILVRLTLPEAPPTDEEKYWYMGRQHRWLLFVQTFALGLVVFSLIRFSLSHPPLWIFLLPAALYVVTSVISLLSSTRRKRVMSSAVEPTLPAPNVTSTQAAGASGTPRAIGKVGSAAS